MTRTSRRDESARHPLGRGPRQTAIPPLEAEQAPFPARRPARFPAASALPPAAPGTRRSQALWAGTDEALRTLVSDHATAVGIDLVDRTDRLAGTGARGGPPEPPAVARIVTADALTGLERSAAPQPSPLLVVTTDGEIGAAVWEAALTAGALALVQLPSGSETLLSHLADLARPPRSSLVIGVTGGCGGAGASSVAARLAAAARGEDGVVLVDADPFGGGLDLLVEESRPGGIRWADVAVLGPDDGEALRSGLPVVDEVSLLVAGEEAGPDAASLSRVLDALSPLGGVVVVDLASALVPVAAPHLDRLLLVVPATDHAVAAASRRITGWQLPSGSIELLVRRRGPLTPGEVAQDLSLPLLSAFRDGSPGTVPLLDVRRRGADRACRLLIDRLRERA